jgi:hypothetical protein
MALNRGSPGTSQKFRKTAGSMPSRSIPSNLVGRRRSATLEGSARRVCNVVSSMSTLSEICRCTLGTSGLLSTARAA